MKMMHPYKKTIHYLVISFWSINFDLVSANQAKFMIMLLFRAEHAANTKKVKVFRQTTCIYISSCTSII